MTKKGVNQDREEQARDDTIAEEEESDATKKGQENSTEEARIGGWIG